ncbi:MAG: hypothetical protein GX824_04575 [Clostridiales bacterium]|jgi:hypothetical protein|nr:hypothetical protein [Clostridiales bacterium]
MSQWDVLTGLRQIIALDEEGAALALPLCSMSLDEIKIRLRDGVSPEDIRVTKAAVGLAYYKLVVRRLAGEEAITSFKAGDVTVSKSSAAALEIAAKIRDESLVDALPLMKDEEFLFRQVRI